MKQHRGTPCEHSNFENMYIEKLYSRFVLFMILGIFRKAVKVLAVSLLIPNFASSKRNSYGRDGISTIRRGSRHRHGLRTDCRNCKCKGKVGQWCYWSPRLDWQSWLEPSAQFWPVHWRIFMISSKNRYEYWLSTRYDIRYNCYRCYK